MRTETKYIANDGKEFDNYDNCVEYESEMLKKNCMEDNDWHDLHDLKDKVKELESKK